MDASEAGAVFKLSSLDDWTMLELMDRLPLWNLLCLGQTSDRFKRLAEKNQAGRHQLGLIFGYGICTSSFQFNSIQMVRFDYQAREDMLAFRSGLTSLQIINNCDSSEVLDVIIDLLDGWADQLEELEVWLLKKIEPEFTAAVPLFGLINRMGKLKKLHFTYYGHLPQDTLHLPVIGQLEKFSFNVREEAETVMRQLLAHATPQLTEIDLWSPFEYRESSILLLDLEPRLAMNFVALKLNTWDMSFPLLVSICQQYRSVENLYVLLNLLTVRQLNYAMAMLPKLTTVFMEVDFSNRRFFRQTLLAAIFLDEPVEPDTTDSNQLVPLPSVTTLQLFPIFGRHTDFDMLHLGVLFPNLVELCFFNIACSACEYGRLDVDFEATHCCLLQLQAKVTFGEMFPKLRKVTYLGRTLPEEEWQPKEKWQPEPPMPRPLFYLVVAFFGIIICRQVGRQLTAATTGQGFGETISKSLLGMTTKALKLVHQPLLSISSIIGPFARK